MSMKEKTTKTQRHKDFFCSLCSLCLCGFLLLYPKQDGELKEAEQLNDEVKKLIISGHLNEAIPLGERALEIGERRLGAEHVGVALVLNNLGEVYYDKGDYDRAESLYKRALAIWERAEDPESPKILPLLNN